MAQEGSPANAEPPSQGAPPRLGPHLLFEGDGVVPGFGPPVVPDICAARPKFLPKASRHPQTHGVFVRERTSTRQP